LTDKAIRFVTPGEICVFPTIEAEAARGPAGPRAEQLVHARRYRHLPAGKI
jgi:hypothetical protein